ncbi:unnamed protein product [Moneuplotes crassus]|uniref:Uncharacterized protein n=1 Tax=Euplotes crassus TaxID=5936 RepID=A0AAD1UHD1_EUPCR|nr:unnamed protein product [Moneuplotes crassus]
MNATNSFEFGWGDPFSTDPKNQFDDEYMVESLNNFEWDIPQEVFEEKHIFEPVQDFPMFNFGHQEKDSGTKNFKTNKNEVFEAKHPQVCLDKISDAQSEAGVKLVEENEAKSENENINPQGLNSTEKSDNSSSRRLSTDNCDCLSDSKEDSDSDTIIRIPNIQLYLKENTPSPACDSQNTKVKSNPEETKPVSKTGIQKEEDPDFCYKAPRKQKFEYNKRKDVILKTILRKCRRVLQDEFNEVTGYFSNRKMQGHQFLKDCIQKFHDTIPVKPESLDLLFYIGAMLYPQEMSRGVDCFFECEKKDRVKQRKFFRAKIQKVHDVLYRYSHEKMDYFVKVPELSYLYTMFYQKADAHKDEDQYYMNGATEIFERCKDTLNHSGISI